MLMFFTLQSVFWWNKGHFEPQLQCWLTAKHVTCLYLVKWEKTVHLVGDNIKNMPLPQTTLAPAVFSSGLFCVWLFTDPLCVFFSLLLLQMFGFHKPKLYRSSDGCCICRAKSSSSRFTDSSRYESHFKNCFGWALMFMVKINLMCWSMEWLFSLVWV